jgi:hypothetical protein
MIISWLPLLIFPKETPSISETTAGLKGYELQAIQ